MVWLVSFLFLQVSHWQPWCWRKAVKMLLTWPFIEIGSLLVTPCCTAQERREREEKHSFLLLVRGGHGLKVFSLGGQSLSLSLCCLLVRHSAGGLKVDEDKVLAANENWLTQGWTRGKQFAAKWSIEPPERKRRKSRSDSNACWQRDGQSFCKPSFSYNYLV